MPSPSRRHPPVKLTKGYVERVRPGARDEFHWDTEAKGFGVRVTPTGKLTFIVQGRVDGSDAPAARVTIGPFGVFTVDQARDVAREHLRSMRMGVDPRDSKRQDEAAKVSLQAVCDRYLGRPGMLKESTKAEMRRHVEQVFDAWRHRPIASITPAECRQRYEKLAREGLRGKGPAPVQASIAMVTLRTLVNFSMSEYQRLDGAPIIERNPVAVLKRDLRPSPPRTRHIDRRSIGKFWNLLTTARGTAINADAACGVDLVKFLLLTGARRNEGAMLTWDRVNIEDDATNCWFYLPDPKNKNPVTLPLSTQAVAILRQRKRVEGNPHVFASRSKAGHIMDARAPLERLSVLIGMDRLSAHDLRRTFVTLGANACGLDVAKLELLTNHVPQSITTRPAIDHDAALPPDLRPPRLPLCRAGHRRLDRGRGAHGRGAGKRRERGEPAGLAPRTALTWRAATPAAAGGKQRPTPERSGPASASSAARCTSTPSCRPSASRTSCP